MEDRITPAGPEDQVAALLALSLTADSPQDSPPAASEWVRRARGLHAAAWNWH